MHSAPRPILRNVRIGIVSGCLLALNPSTHAANVRATARTSVNTNANVNVNRNVNVNQNVDVNVNRGPVYSGGCCYHEYHPVATAAAVATTVAVVGAVVASIPPSCTTVVVNGLSYRQCGSTWYQPQISGSSTTYVVVNPPR